MVRAVLGRRPGKIPGGWNRGALLVVARGDWRACSAFFSSLPLSLSHLLIVPHLVGKEKDKLRFGSFFFFRISVATISLFLFHSQGNVLFARRG